MSGLRVLRRSTTVVLLAAAALASAGCFPVPIHVASAPSRFDASSLEGAWHVVATNFPMWVAGDKREPVFEYHLLPSDEAVLLDDAVRFRVEGRPDAYLGVDEQDPGNDSHFTWRGKGALSLFSSEWYVAGLASDGAWAIVYYTATIASPDGVDVIARTPSLPEERLAEAHAVIANDPLLREKARGLVVLSGSRAAAAR